MEETTLLAARIATGLEQGTCIICPMSPTSIGVEVKGKFSFGSPLKEWQDALRFVLQEQPGE